MFYPNTVSELTGDRYNELKFTYTNADDKAITGSFVEDIVTLLAQCQFFVDSYGEHEPNVYDEPVAIAVREFQKKYMGDSVASGILTNATLQSMIYCEDRQQDVIEDDEGNITYQGNIEGTNSPHYSPFFETDNFKQFRQNRRDIKIVFGNSGIVKTIHDVIMRSVSVEVNTSGEPISEVYEFIGRDLTESDEISDAMKYANEQNSTPSDIQYKFNFTRE